MPNIKNHQSITISAAELARLVAEIKNDPGYQKQLANRIKSWKPDPNNRCKNEGCEGEVTQRVRGATSDGYHYTNPACNVCGRIYLGAVNVRTNGIAEFQKLMNTSYGL